MRSSIPELARTPPPSHPVERVHALWVELVAVIILLAGIAALHVTYSTGISAHLFNDYASHFNLSAGVYARLTTPPHALAAQLNAVLDAGREYPPLFYAWTAGIFAIFGVSEQSAYLGQAVVATLLCLAVYLFMRPRCGRTIAATATLLVGTSPAIVLTAAVCSPELIKVTCVFCALALLASDPRFERAGPSVGFGVAAGLSLLAKWNALSYLAPVAFVCAACTLRESPLRARWHFALLAALTAQATFLTPPLTDSRPAVAELFAVIVSLCIGLSALVLLRANASRPTRHLTLALISFWAVTYGAYVAILPRFAHHVRDYQIVWWSRHETSLLWYPAVPAFLGSFPGMTLCLAAGLGYASRRGISQWPWRVLALGFFCGLVATGLARMPYHVRYHAALVPLAVVLSTFWWRQAPARMRVALVALGLTIGLLQGALITSTVSASALWPQTVWGLVDAFHHFHSEHHETRTDARNRVQMLARRLPDMLSLRTPASSGATQVAAAPLHVLVVVEPELCQGATEVMLWKPVWETWLAYGIDGGAPVAFVGNSRHPDDVSGFRVRTTPPGNAPSDTTSTGTSQAVLEALRLSTSFSSSPPIPGGASVPTAGGTPVDAVLLLAPADRIESATARVIGALDTHVATVATYAMPDHCAVRVLAPVVWAGP